MQRHEVIQSILDLFPAPSYLEIGVDQGATFHLVRAARKVAVDVRFAFDWQGAARDPANRSCRYVETSSDEFFEARRDDKRYDVVFIDGLHSYEQVLRDLLNSWSVLAPGGVIVVDDILPSTYAASLPSLDRSREFWTATNNPDGSWMGDVYKLGFFVESFLPALSYATVAENHGQMILWCHPRQAYASRSLEDTCRVQFIDTVLQRSVFQIKPFARIIEELTRDR